MFNIRVICLCTVWDIQMVFLQQLTVATKVSAAEVIVCSACPILNMGGVLKRHKS